HQCRGAAAEPRLPDLIRPSRSPAPCPVGNILGRAEEALIPPRGNDGRRACDGRQSRALTSMKPAQFDLGRPLWQDRRGATIRSLLGGSREETDMCFVDSDWSRRGFLANGMVAGGAMGTASLGRSLFVPGAAEGAETAPRGNGPGAAGVNFKWFGTNGWEITFGNKTILIDPWFNRFESGFLQNKL